MFTREVKCFSDVMVEYYNGYVGKQERNDEFKNVTQHMSVSH